MPVAIPTKLLSPWHTNTPSVSSSPSVHPLRNTRRPLVLACVMLAMFMVAIEATIVATAMPEIVGQLGGFALYSWVFSAFLLSQTTTIVIFGKLSDLYGRRPVLIGGI